MIFKIKEGINPAIKSKKLFIYETVLKLVDRFAKNFEKLYGFEKLLLNRIKLIKDSIKFQIIFEGI